MRLMKVVDGVWMKFAGFALIRSGKRGEKKYTWTPRYAPDGSVYMWLRSEVE